MGTVATAGDPVIQMHKNTAQSARAAMSGLPVVSSAGMRAGHAEILEAALADTRKALGELAHVGDVGAEGAGGLADQDRESGQKFGNVQVTKTLRNDAMMLRDFVAAHEEAEQRAVRGWESGEIQVKPRGATS